ncbi:DivIVA domain-containing protein [Deinococcus pimensis]|uniref:DivIVA domain-containing protein n=1 Tax=Deinococcus pimensis TaxID=309888 RepID=UPI0004B4A8D9|nr:DivIVA domain-containing protein [Deinococcus pimensis]
MKLTPLDIRHQEFAGALSGYSRRQVRAFLAELSEQVEDLLREQLAHEGRITELERRIEEYRLGEEELKRTLVAAERITQEMRSVAQREAELVVREAEAERDRVVGDMKSRQAWLEQEFQTRQSELEGAYRARQTELEGAFVARSTALEHEALARRTELENSLARLRAERAQFLAQYRALLQGFGELARHHEAELESGEPLGKLSPATPVPTVDAEPESAPLPVGAPADEAGEDHPVVPTFSHHL